MIKQVTFCSETINYHLQYKKVKNINLRIKPDGSVFVSAARYVPQGAIDAFVLSKAEFIKKTQKQYENQSKIVPQPLFSESEVRQIILEFCQKVYPYFAKQGIPYPKIKFRQMVSRWGSCHTAKGILTFNTNLRFAPLECIEYVVWHEFTHFLQPNHSALFYEELVKVCPNWKVCKKQLKEILIR